SVQVDPGPGLVEDHPVGQAELPDQLQHGVVGAEAVVVEPLQRGSVDLHRRRQPAQFGGSLQHRHVMAGLHRVERGGQPGGTSPDNAQFHRKLHFLLTVYWKSSTTGRDSALTRLALMPSQPENTSNSRKVSPMPAAPTV